MKSIDETIQSVLEKREQAEERREKRNDAIKKASVTAACVLAALLVAVVYLGDFHFPSKSPEDTSAAAVAAQVASDDKDQSTNFGGSYDVYVMPSTDAVTAALTAAPVPESESGSSYGAEVLTTASPDGETTSGAITEADSSGVEYSTEIPEEGVTIPPLPNGKAISTAGEKITDEEAAAFFAKHLAGIRNELTASGVPADELRISEKGYSHLSFAYYEERPQLEVREDLRDYLAYNGDSLVAIITLSKENGEIHGTSSFGAAWFEQYDSFLDAHKGQTLVYIYLDLGLNLRNIELIITPEGKAYFPLFDKETMIRGVDDPYHTFYHQSDVYTP